MKERLTRAWAALALLLAAVALALPASAAGPALAATEAYCIMDAESGLVLAQQNMNEELHPASITKVMTLGLACEKAQGDWSGMVTVSHEDVYSLVGTDSSHIALLEGEQVPLEALLYATMMASANDGANALAEYFGGGSIADGVAAMNAQAAELGLQHTHFANPHGISDDGHYTSCYDMATILRWALTQPGFEQLFTNNEMYIMQPTNLQPVTRYFSQQDSMRIGSSMFHEPTILGSKIGYTDIARQTYICLAEKNGVRVICVTMRSESKTDRYADVRALLDYAFSTWTGYAEIPPAQGAASVTVQGGGGALGELSLDAPGVRLRAGRGRRPGRAEPGCARRPAAPGGRDAGFGRGPQRRAARGVYPGRQAGRLGGVHRARQRRAGGGQRPCAPAGPGAGRPAGKQPQADPPGGGRCGAGGLPPSDPGGVGGGRRAGGGRRPLVWAQAGPRRARRQGRSGRSGRYPKRYLNP